MRFSDQISFVFRVFCADLVDNNRSAAGLEDILRLFYTLPLSCQNAVAHVTEEMGVGMARYIARDLRTGTKDKADYDHYCHLVAGTVGDGLTRLFVAVGYEDPALVGEYNLWNDMGIFLQTTNIIRDYLEDLVDGRAFWPRAVYLKYVDNLADMRLDIPSPAADLAKRTSRGLACLDEMVAEALELTPHCLDYLGRLSNLEVLRFCAVPQVSDRIVRASSNSGVQPKSKSFEVIL